MGCSVAAVRKFVRMKGIDRKYDVTFVRWKRIHDYCKENPEATNAEKKAALGYSINTIKKYENLSEEQIYKSKRDTWKVSDFDIRNRNAIKSISNNQNEILGWILHLYNEDRTFEADLTASLLVFYKTIPTPKHLYDKYPQLPQVKDLKEVDALPDGSFSSIVYDLPFILSNNSSSVIKERFTNFFSVEEMFTANDEMLERSYRLLQTDGLLVVKTMDTSINGKQYWVSDYVLRNAQDMGLELIDKFILTSSYRLISKTKVQHLARKYHSYFFVFRKR
jgi:hypothetical protein